MKRTELFSKTRKDAPADEVSKNAQLLIKAGFVHKEMAGAYSYLPLGLRVIENIKQIVREEMEAIGGKELLMTSIQPKSTWEPTDRWSDEIVDIWFKSKLQDGTEVGFGWSHEEPIVEMIKQHLSSYKDLPINVYQFQNKLRNELRAKSGVMRGREFLMKDMYSCSIDEEQHEKFYQEAIEAYKRVFDRLGIGKDTYVTFASGGAFTQFSHEFQTVCEAGEDIIYVHKQKNIAVNEEVLNEESLAKLGVTRDELEEVKSAEVGNIFNFGTQKSEDMNFTFTNEQGQKQFVHLGSYGIGISRLMGVIAEKYSDDRGLVWAEDIAPAKVCLARLGDTDDVVATADEIYNRLTENGITVLYDDRDARPGEKFADADLMGIPYRVVVSAKTTDTGKHELKKRTESEVHFLGVDELLKALA